MVALAAAAMLPTAMVSAFVVSPNNMRLGGRASPSLRAATATMSADVGKKRVLVIGGTRFSGLYLTKELHSRGHEVRFLCSCCLLGGRLVAVFVAVDAHVFRTHVTCVPI